MARGKKKENLSLEEKLERALVPVEEQPYEVPGNWCWTYQNVVCQLGDGEKRNNEEHPYLEVKYLRGYKEADLKYTGKYIETNTKVILVDGENSGEVFEISEAGYMGSTFKTLNISAGINEKYILYFVDSKRDLLRNSKTGSAIPHLNKKLFFSLGFPLPPMQEQRRIVERIESLFAKLDEAKEKVQEVIAQHGLRITSILHKAFLGDLSLEWRIMHGMTKENWEVKRIKDVCKPRAGYAFDSKKFQNHGCQIIRMGNLYGGVLDLSRSPVFICEDELDERMIDRAKIKHGDILITLTGTKYKRDYGYAVCIENPENLYVNQRILCLTPNENINRDYLLHYLRSNVFRDIFFSNETGGVNQGNVSSKFVENIAIQIPSIEEQRVIVRELNSMLLKEAQIAELGGCVLQRIDLMKKSILAKAFRGELGTNNPDEESAIELLKTILVET